MSFSFSVYSLTSSIMNTLIVVLLFVSQTLAWQFKPDDTEYWKQQPEILSSKRLKAFKKAASNEDHKKIASLLQDLKSMVEDANENNKSKGPVFQSLISRMKTLSDKQDLDQCNGSGGRLRLLLAAIDGNKDNKSYYLYESAIQWIEKRLKAANGLIDDELSEIKDLIVEARESINTFGHTFGKGVKDMRKLLLNRQGKKNAAEIRRIVSGIIAQSKKNRTNEATEEAIKKINQLIAKEESRKSGRKG